MKVLMNVASSADGKIGPPDRAFAQFGSAEDRRRMSLVRRRADAVVTGGATFRSGPHVMVENEAHFPDPVLRERPPLNAVVTRSGDLPWDARFFMDPRVRPLVILPEPEAARARALAPPRVDVVGVPVVHGRAVLDVLEQRGATTTLLEGGGGLAALFFRDRLVSELYLTVVPLLLGGSGAPTPLDGAPFAVADAPRLELLECAVRGNETFLHYAVSYPGEPTQR